MGTKHIMRALRKAEATAHTKFYELVERNNAKQWSDPKWRGICAGRLAEGRWIELEIARIEAERAALRLLRRNKRATSGDVAYVTREKNYLRGLAMAYCANEQLRPFVNYYRTLFADYFRIGLPDLSYRPK